MRAFLPALFLALLWVAIPASAQVGPPTPAGIDRPTIDPERLRCLREPERCGRFTRVVSFPAHALTQSNAAAFQLESRGVRWLSKTGRMEFAMRRPRDFNDEPLRISFLFAASGDADGQTVGFNVLPANLRNLSEYETYAGKSTHLAPSPSPGDVGERSLVFSPGDPHGRPMPGTGWWNFEVTRIGDYDGPLRLMAVSIEY